jgi:hypothetical protein
MADSLKRHHGTFFKHEILNLTLNVRQKDERGTFLIEASAEPRKNLGEVEQSGG